MQREAEELEHTFYYSATQLAGIPFSGKETTTSHAARSFQTQQTMAERVLKWTAVAAVLLSTATKRTEHLHIASLYQDGVKSKGVKAAHLL